MAYTSNTDNINLLSEENVKKYVLPSYNLQNSIISQIKFKNTKKQRAVYKISNNGQNYCLKKVYFDEPDLLFVYSAIEWFYRNNINVPRILPTLDKNRFVYYKGMFFILTPWIDGEKCNYDKMDDITLASSNLANMHNCTINFFPIKKSIFREGYNDLFTSTKKHFEQILNCSNLAFKYQDNFSKEFLKNFDTNSKLALISTKVASTINNENLNKSLCHMDYVNKNIIIDNDNNIWIIDFDKCKMDYSAHDISYFLRRALKRDRTKWNLEVALNTLKFYEDIRPLNFDDHKYILAYLAFPQKYWKLSRDYYNNIDKCNKNSFLTLLYKAIRNDYYQLQFTMEFIDYIETKFNEKIL